MTNTCSPATHTETWLLTHIKEDPDNTQPVSRQDLYSKYVQSCEEVNMIPLRTAGFGRVVKRLFPEVKSRRLGPRGATSYHHVGITWFQGNSNHPEESADDLDVWLSKLKTSIPTIRHVPKGARSVVAEALSQLLEEVIATNSLPAWRDLLSFSYSTLATPHKSEKVKNLTTYVKRKIQQWVTNRSKAFPLPRPPNPSYSAIPTDASIAKKTEAKLADGDIHGAVRLLFSDDTVAPHDDETVQALLEKHPSHPEPAVFPDCPEEGLVQDVELEELKRAILSFPSGSAGGIDGMRPQILKDLIAVQEETTRDRLLSALISFSTFLLHGTTPLFVRPIIFGATLTALRKKAGGIRPVAVGTAWRRLAAKIICKRIQGPLVEHLSPYQLGVGIPGGAEAGAHAGAVYLNAEHSGPRVFLKLDFKNAFNELRRDIFLREVKERFPAAYPFIYSCYRESSHLFFGSSLLTSSLGCQQGDPLGPAIFALALHPLVQALRTALNVRYLDDGTIGDTPDEVLSALATVQSMASDLGLHLNIPKCEVKVLGIVSAQEKEEILARFRQTAPDIRVMTRGDAQLLGAPLTSEAIEVMLREKTRKLASISPRLLQLNPQAAFFLIRASVSFPRLLYFLRCSPAWMNFPLLEEYDLELKSSLESILNICFSPDEWTQSSLPVKKGGLGMRHAVVMAIPCFLASFNSALPLLESLVPAEVLESATAPAEALALWKLAHPEAIVPESASSRRQDLWEMPYIQRTLDALSASAQHPEDKARCLAVQTKESGAWLNALPSPQLGTLMPRESFRTAVALRLGADICQPHRCLCGTEVTSRGLHGLSCRRDKGRQSRHSSANDIILRALRTAEVPAIREPTGCSRTDGKRPDGQTLVPWTRGRSLLWDFSCRDTYAPSYLGGTSVAAGYAAGVGEGEKRRKYGTLTNQYEFVPVVIETSGVWGAEAKDFIAALGSRISALTGQKKASQYLVERLSIAVQRGNVASILGTITSGQELDEVFFL